MCGVSEDLESGPHMGVCIIAFRSNLEWRATYFWVSKPIGTHYWYGAWRPTSVRQAIGLVGTSLQHLASSDEVLTTKR